jgi:hypothetical protein
MRKLITSTLATLLGCALVVLVSGCPDGDKAIAPVNRDGGTFTLSKPSDVTIKRGDTAKVKISVERKNNLNDALDVKFGKLPKGVQVNEGEAKIAERQNSVEVTLSAAADAELLTNHEIEVSVQGGGAGPATQKFNLTIKEK